MSVCRCWVHCRCQFDVQRLLYGLESRERAIVQKRVSEGEVLSVFAGRGKVRACACAGKVAVSAYLCLYGRNKRVFSLKSKF